VLQERCPISIPPTFQLLVQAFQPDHVEHNGFDKDSNCVQHTGGCYESKQGAVIRRKGRTESVGAAVFHRSGTSRLTPFDTHSIICRPDATIIHRPCGYRLILMTMYKT